jgi:N-acetylglucosaminyldiphosphoundecaprenol N-acetyl-beta-D-mannosaminyltransferase
VDDVGWDGALAYVDAFVSSGRPHHIMTPNPEYVMLARRAPTVRELLEEVDLALPDGVGLRWASALLGDPVREVVPGSELVERMAPEAAARGDRWFLLGAEEGVAETVGRRLAAANPGLVIAGTFSGSPHVSQEDENCRRIEAAGPVDVLLVAYGAPAQDLWIARNQPRLKVPVAIGVGGTFNFIAGRSPRPPELVKRLQLIWLFRLITEPWRWRRQLALARFAALVAWQAVGRRRA